MKFGDMVLKKDEASGKSTWSGQPKGRARPAMAMKMSIKNLSVQKRTKQVTGNAQWLVSKSILTGDHKKPKHRKAHSYWLFVTGKNLTIRYGT